MSILGKLLSTPIRLLNVPARLMEDLANGGEKTPKNERIFSVPLDTLADKIDEAVDKDGGSK